MCSRLWLDEARPWSTKLKLWGGRSTDADLSNSTTNLLGFRTDTLKRLCGCVLVKMYTKCKKQTNKANDSRWKMPWTFVFESSIQIFWGGEGNCGPRHADTLSKPELSL